MRHVSYRREPINSSWPEIISGTLFVDFPCLHFPLVPDSLHLRPSSRVPIYQRSPWDRGGFSSGVKANKGQESSTSIRFRKRSPALAAIDVRKICANDLHLYAQGILGRRAQGYTRKWRLDAVRTVKIFVRPPQDWFLPNTKAIAAKIFICH